MEAGVLSIAAKAQQQAAVAYENAPYLPTNHPCRTLLEEPCSHRLKRPSWRSAAKVLMNRVLETIFSKNVRQTLLACPWDNGRCYQKENWHPNRELKHPFKPSAS